MSANASTARDVAEMAQKRAQREQLAFDVDSPGLVEVTNKSYETPADHQYTVSNDDVTGELLACTCPFHIHCSAVCKHKTTVEIATDDSTLATFSRQITRTM